MPDHQASLQCPATKCPCSAQPQGIPAASFPAVPNRRVSLPCPDTKSCSALQCPDTNIPALPNRRVSAQCPAAEYPCSAQPQISLQCPTTKLPCSDQPIPTAKYPCSVQCLSILSIFAVPNPQVAQCPTTKYPRSAQPAEYPCSAQPRKISAVPMAMYSLQCPNMPKPTVFCSAQWQSFPVTKNNHRVFMQRSKTEYPGSAQPCSISAMPMAMYPCSIFAVLSGQVSLWCPALAMPNPTDANFC